MTSKGKPGAAPPAGSETQPTLADAAVAIVRGLRDTRRAVIAAGVDLGERANDGLRRILEEVREF